MTTEELAWVVAADRYAGAVQMGATPRELAPLWAKADDALNKLTGVRQPDKTETLEIDAVR